MESVFVGGFSQGCTVSLASFLLYKEVLKGCVGLSGAHNADIDILKIPQLEEKKKAPMFLYHGQEDPMISEELAKLTYQTFAEHGFTYDFHSEPSLEHSLSLEEIEKLKAFFGKLMV